MFDFSKTLFVLGADDPEMSEIERLLLEAHAHCWHVVADGARCHPGNAYKAKLPALVSGYITNVVLIECDVAGLKATRLDHHREGDPGFGRGPAEFASASSLGQFLALIGEEPDKKQLLIMAADHCLAAAYSGQCPGVTPIDLRDYRARMMGQRYGLSDEEMCDRWDAATQVVQNAPMVDLGGTIRDLRGLVVDDLPEILCIRGEAGLYRRTDPRSGLDKLGILGAGAGTQPGTTPVEAFLTAGRESGSVLGVPVHTVYGDAVRGFCGATIEDQLQ